MCCRSIDGKRCPQNIGCAGKILRKNCRGTHKCSHRRCFCTVWCVIFDKSLICFRRCRWVTCSLDFWLLRKVICRAVIWDFMRFFFKKTKRLRGLKNASRTRSKSDFSTLKYSRSLFQNQCRFEILCTLICRRNYSRLLLRRSRFSQNCTNYY